MTTTTRPRMTLALAVAALAGGLTACQADQAGRTATSTQVVTTSSAPTDATTQAQTTATVTETSTAQQTSDQQTSDQSASGSSTQQASSDGSTGQQDQEPARCSTEQLELTAKDAGSGAGSSGLTLVFRNTGAKACTMTGYPSVRAVGPGQDTPIGKPAAKDTSGDDIPVTLEPGKTAQALLLITSTGPLGDDCKPVKASGFKVVPDDEEAALFLKRDNLQACSGEVTWLKVRAVEKGA